MKANSCILLTAVFFLLISCKQGEKKEAHSNKYPSPEGYDLNKPTTIDLSTQLDEISGIFYYGKDTSVFAISDATGSLYKIFPNRKTLVQKWKFGKSDDYEDVVLVDSTFYILSSSGSIVGVRFNSSDSIETMVSEFPEKRNEFESMYYDKALGTLVLICKDCIGDKKSALSVWSYDLQTFQYTPGPYTIDVSVLAREMEMDKIRFKPSAGAVNPLTKELFLISAINRLLVILDKDGSVVKSYPLNPKIFKQPEGLSFTAAGDLLISNEYADVGNANILIMKYKKSKVE